MYTNAQIMLRAVQRAAVAASTVETDTGALWARGKLPQSVAVARIQAAQNLAAITRMLADTGATLAHVQAASAGAVAFASQVRNELVEVLGGVS